MHLINNIRAFLIEMGGDFTFVGNQYYLVVGNRDLYIDLLLFHRRLRSLVAIELKIGEFEAEYALKQSNVPIGVATYKLSDSLPEDMKEMLPEPEEIVRRLRVFEEG